MADRGLPLARGQELAPAVYVLPAGKRQNLHCPACGGFMAEIAGDTQGHFRLRCRRCREDRYFHVQPPAST